MSVDEHGVVEIREEGGEGSAWLARLGAPLWEREPRMRK